MIIFCNISQRILLEIASNLDIRSKISIAKTNRVLLAAINRYLKLSVEIVEVKEHANLSTLVQPALQIKTTAEHLQLMKLAMNALLDYLMHDNPPRLSEHSIYSRWLPGCRPRLGTNFFLSGRKERQKAYYLLKWLPHSDNTLDLITLLYQVTKEEKRLKKKLLPLITDSLQISVVHIEEATVGLLQKLAIASLPLGNIYSHFVSHNISASVEGILKTNKALRHT